MWGIFHYAFSNVEKRVDSSPPEPHLRFFLRQYIIISQPSPRTQNKVLIVIIYFGIYSIPSSDDIF